MEQEETVAERRFLHDLSNPLAIAYGNLRIVASKVEKGTLSIEDAVIKLNKAIKAFDRANALLEDRRKILKDDT